MVIKEKILESFDRKATSWMAANGIFFLRLSIGIVFLWFGVLKFFPGVSPADLLASKTIHMLSFGLIGAEISMPMLALWETLIGLGLISGLFLRATLLLLLVQMIGTFMPLFILPLETFARYPYVPTLVGQYIIKNLVVVSAAIVLGATVRGGKLTSES